MAARRVTESRTSVAWENFPKNLNFPGRSTAA